MVLYQGEKMAKSLGNLVMVSNLLKYNNANEIKWLLLSHHYRKPWEFEKEELELIKKKLLMIKKVIKTNKNQKINTLYVRKFITIMDNDLNTPQALNFILDIVKKPNLSPTILKCLSILGIEL